MLHCQAVYIGETGNYLNTRLTEHKRATRNGEINNHIAEQHLETNHRMTPKAGLLTCSKHRCQQPPAPYKRLIDDNNKTGKQ